MRCSVAKSVYFDSHKAGFTNRLFYFVLATITSLCLWLLIISVSLLII